MSVLSCKKKQIHNFNLNRRLLVQLAQSLNVLRYNATKTRSTGTVHTSAKARLTSVAIRIRIQIRILDPDRHQNFIICPLAHYQPSLRISCKYVRTFYAKLLTNRQTNKQRRKHILLGGGNNEKFYCPFVQIDKSDRLCIRFMYANKMMGLEYLSKSNLRINESYAAFTTDAMPRGAVRCLALRCFPLSTRLHISPRCGENDASCRTAPRGISVCGRFSVGRRLVETSTD